MEPCLSWYLHREPDKQHCGHLEGPEKANTRRDRAPTCAGNGTEACVAACAPHMAKFSFKTAFSAGSQTFQVYRPWLGARDCDNILFARSAQAEPCTLHPES